MDYHHHWKRSKSNKNFEQNYMYDTMTFERKAMTHRNGGGLHSSVWTFKEAFVPTFSWSGDKALRNQSRAGRRAVIHPCLGWLNWERAAFTVNKAWATEAWVTQAEHCSPQMCAVAARDDTNLPGNSFRGLFCSLRNWITWAKHDLRMLGNSQHQI